MRKLRVIHGVRVQPEQPGLAICHRVRGSWRYRVKRAAMLPAGFEV